MSHLESFSNFFQLSCTFCTSPVDRCTNSNSSHIPCTLNSTEHCLIKLIRIAKEFVVIDLYNERNFVSKLSACYTKNTVSRSNTIAAAFHSQLNNILRIEIN